jgi:hypothetical protein
MPCLPASIPADPNAEQQYSKRAVLSLENRVVQQIKKDVGSILFLGRE